MHNSLIWLSFVGLTLETQQRVLQEIVMEGADLSPHTETRLTDTGALQVAPRGWR